MVANEFLTAFTGGIALTHIARSNSHQALSKRVIMFFLLPIHCFVLCVSCLRGRRSSWHGNGISNDWRSEKRFGVTKSIKGLLLRHLPLFGGIYFHTAPVTLQLPEAQWEELQKAGSAADPRGANLPRVAHTNPAPAADRTQVHCDSFRR